MTLSEFCRDGRISIAAVVIQSNSPNLFPLKRSTLIFRQGKPDSAVEWKKSLTTGATG